MSPHFFSMSTYAVLVNFLASHRLPQRPFLAIVGGSLVPFCRFHNIFHPPLPEFGGQANRPFLSARLRAFRSSASLSPVSSALTSRKCSPFFFLLAPVEPLDLFPIPNVPQVFSPNSYPFKGTCEDLVR